MNYMNKELRIKLISTVERIINLLVKKRYAEIALLTKKVRLNETQIGEAVSEYGRTLVGPPPSFHEHIDIIPVTNSTPQRWSVVFPLWTLEEGESDLSVEITCVDNKDDVFEIELDNIHTL